ncbi:MAG: N-acetylmuramoyl-L-alanine amidase [Clostridia bacterium]|nr:N-acetylmuramoyl-L-alanine amidase [Clostridia bacterium]
MSKCRWLRWAGGGIAGLCLLLFAVAPRPARPAVPARPVRQEEAGGLSGRVILVDAGHGGDDGGARARDSGLWEKEINLLVAQALREELEESGASVIMSREGDMQYSAKKREDLTARLDLARQHGADMVVSIHMNEYRTRRESGPQVFYREGQENSRLLAGAIQAALIRTLHPVRERSAMAGDYFILSLDVPSVLVECGFLSNAAEEARLLTPDYRRQVAQAIRDGIQEYFLLAPEHTPQAAPAS